MAKVALLIGVSQYQVGLNPLPAAVRDVEAMERVLKDPKIGNFDAVKKLINPERQVMAEAIEHLFDGRQKDDLILLFFSGHGIKDESGKLYFATRNTRKTDKGLLVKATTVPASFVHDVMSNSRSKREVVILDCCFSGAFAEGMSAKENGFVDVKNQLGGEGRAVLTSSTSTQYSFEDTGTDTSTYTRYIVEGLETGAADKDEDGWITVDELHEYATTKVQEAAPAMKPEIYAIKEGFKINLAKAPNDDPYLRYRREVHYWVEAGKGEISFIGRAALEEQRNQLKLTTAEADEIERQVLEPRKIYEQKLDKYKEIFKKQIEIGFPLSDQSLNELKRLQEILGLTDEAIALITSPILAEKLGNKYPRYTSIFSYINGKIWNYLAGVICGIIIGITLSAMRPEPISKSCPVPEEDTGDRISIGEQILLTQNKNSDKQAGVQAFTQGDCTTAIEKFESYRKIEPADPEALIYLNNARAIHSKKYLKIAVSVPIGTEFGIAKEMLRGVAQAQNEVNDIGGINGKLLKVAIANDNNDPGKAVDIAEKFVEDTDILAVVGHNSSNVSKAAASVYQQKGLVMMSPTSYAQSIADNANYIFRTAPSVKSITDIVARYAIKNLNKRNFLICVDRNIDNGSVKENFIQALKAAGGTINPTDCDIDSSKFDAKTVISEAQDSGADGLVLAHYVDKSRDKKRTALALLKANQGQLSLFSTPAIFTKESLEEGKYIKDIIISVPWHSTPFPNDAFASNAQILWKAPVSWRTATSYDATKAIIAGLQKSNTREGLKEALRDSDFSVDGATGTIQFDRSGDRVKSPMFLVQVQQKPGTNTYEFVPIKD
ncbi:ABC transporter substrate-binding protein [Nodularia harveyana UHCC-0300]|uniref:ABC transporter substrate-binding protein n=1 Tax=Nodularia harveyana UHCC-0300 TaxID=2974287 RepID=A0ABU5U9E3_9CYAN|nr:ABC transporter substrate-binding protein [Nodularia harveyana]MEA5580137.1 ABC transporter substrate-binding protein [Nodularia harveyana UHCC-0300]